MNKQLQLLGNEFQSDVAPKVANKAKQKFSKRRLGKRDIEIANSPMPWKLSETDRNQGLAGIAMIKQILASAPNNFDIIGDGQFAQAS